MLALAVLPFRLVFIAASKIASSRLLLLAAVVGVGALVLRGVMSGGGELPYPVAYYQEHPPAFSEAPLMGQTATRAYYIGSTLEDGAILWLTDFYSFDTGEWEHQTTPLPLPADSIKIYKRANPVTR